MVCEQGNETWVTAPDYEKAGLSISSAKFLEVTNLLLENPNLNSTHLFRADILYDSSGHLKTKEQKEQACGASDVPSYTVEPRAKSYHNCGLLPSYDGRPPHRTVIRRLIPRNTNIDKPLDQACHFYDLDAGRKAIIYVPEVDRGEDMPWYHPPIKALAYEYKINSTIDTPGAKLSIRYQAFPDAPTPLPSRLHRTFLSLLNTFIRLAKHPGRGDRGNDEDHQMENISSSLAASLKDTIIPQHLVQDTYARLKHTYATDLIARWVEQTEPSKHVFEDLSIAAFLIELWKQMYNGKAFPGFVDLACGNGVLVYILIKEGYHGRGFDARRRKTWSVLGIDDCLAEMICVPKPFLDTLRLTSDDAISGAPVHDGIFHPSTFIISNHADELTPWTPLLAALSSPSQPLPFLAIPCCSHALSGAKHRYTPKDGQSSAFVNGQEDQPANGDLRALRAAKSNAAKHQDDKSQYACLTRKVVAIAEELGIEIELTMMRIPSTRNIGIAGNRKPTARSVEDDMQRMALSEEDASQSALTKINNLIERECRISGGLQPSARTWISRAQKLQTGQGRGKVNLGYKPSPS